MRWGQVALLLALAGVLSGCSPFGDDLGGPIADAVEEQIEAKTCVATRRETPSDVASRFHDLPARSDQSVQVLCKDGYGGPIVTIFYFDSATDRARAWKHYPRHRHRTNFCLSKTEIVNSLVDQPTREFCPLIGALWAGGD